MTTTAPMPTVAPVRSRSVIVPVLAALVIAVSAIGSILSAIILLMIVAGGDGTSNNSVGGFLLLVVLPPATLVAGVALLLRHRWAWVYLVVLLISLLAYNAYEFTRPPATTTTTVSPTGVKTTVISSGPQYSVPIVAICLGLLVTLMLPRIRGEFFKPRATRLPPGGIHPWQVGHTGRDAMYYEEFHDGAWQRIEIQGEMLMGRAHHVIYFASSQRWQEYPAWARDRRGEIIARVKSQFHPPDYEYQEDTSLTPPPLPGVATLRHDNAPAASMIRPTARVPIQTVRPTSDLPRWQRLAYYALVIAILLGVTVGMAWLVTSGLTSGETVYPGKRASQHRGVVRQQEPALFWFAIVLYAAIGVGTFALTVWGIWVGSRQKSTRQSDAR